MPAVEENGLDLREVESRASERWTTEGTHEGKPDPGREKFFATYPYSYMNAFAHIGHAFTMGRVDFFVRYQRMLGKNVLFPFAYHVTGTPIVAAANRVRDNEPQQIRILEQQGVPADEVRAFADPVHWIKFFPKEWRQDVENLGLHVDWRREFHTTDLNPHYDAFIRWQFRRLKEGGYVVKGRHPVIWCPTDQAPVADHDRYEGEGETPQEYTLIKFPLPEQDAFLVAATLRPETMFGQTNLWVRPDINYARIRMDGREKWIVAEAAVDRLAHQHKELQVETVFPGRELIGKRVYAPARDTEIPILPASFVSPEKGTGVVTSVPSDAPDDYVALRDIRENNEILQEFGLDPLAVGMLAPIPIIRTEGYGPLPAVEVVERMGITSQDEREKLEKAKDEVYKAGFYQGSMAATAGSFTGMPVEKAKDEIKQWLLDQGHAALYYEPTGPVTCRCLTPATVKIVSDQWFVHYGDPAWKKKTREALDSMRLYPEVSRKQFNHVIGWLRDWACAREAGLGTHIPWDDKWLIESLSDSTIYMAYYTLAHLLEQGTVTGRDADGRTGVDAADLTDAFFDHVLLGNGTAEAAAKGTVTKELVERCREEFTYWYPLDFRNSGKDLLQNHLSFMIFNHVAMWDDPGCWPQSIGVNGWVTVDGEKMSKSRGNFITLRQALADYGATGTRLALAYAGEGLDDANFDREFADNAGRRLKQWLAFVQDVARNKVDTRVERLPVDGWFESSLHRIVSECKAAMDETMFRSALKLGYFDLHREWQWYLRRSGGKPHADVLREFVDVQTRILTPFAPHVAEACHAALGKTGLAIDAPYPAADPEKLSPEMEEAERYVKGVLEDVREILKVTKMEPKRLILYTAPAWKERMYRLALGMAEQGKVNQGALMKEAMQDEETRKHGKEAPKLAADLMKSLATLGEDDVHRRQLPLDETATLEAAHGFFESEFGAEVEVHAADEPNLPDPAGKAKLAAPRRPAILVE